MSSNSPSWDIVLTPHTGIGPIDDRIRKAQEDATRHSDPRPALERLGWLYVAKARSQHDPGFYTLARHCAEAIQERQPESQEALLLRGHVAQSLHRFAEAEALGRQLIARRGLAADHGLLGDALADQGRLLEAIPQYQRMVDLRPDLQSYSRVAHVRWLKGDVTGAIEAARLAAGAASSADPEAAAWAYTRLAQLEFQNGAVSEAARSCAFALGHAADHPGALLLQGRMRLAEGRPDEAIEPLRRAVASSPLPEFQWPLVDALRAAGRNGDADVVETELIRTGEVQDPRGLALFLATRGKSPARALRLARRELRERADVFSHDALAWALFNSGYPAEAWEAATHALVEGTQDARLFLHAGVIAAALNRPEAAGRLKQAAQLRHLLLPSEHRRLEEALRASAAGPLPAPDDQPPGRDAISAKSSRMPGTAPGSSARLPSTTTQ